ncbi:hypothetical protein B0H13DRAFT_1881095 [Mycena leptocephala]|nr:hypothetical protein B0H13DRAFT_1881095 [Mycena leptocephala]
MRAVYDARGINIFEQGAEEALLRSTQTNGQLITRSFDDRTRSLWKREQSSKDWGIPDENESMNLITDSQREKARSNSSDLNMSKLRAINAGAVQPRLPRCLSNFYVLTKSEESLQVSE